MKPFGSFIRSIRGGPNWRPRRSLSRGPLRALSPAAPLPGIGWGTILTGNSLFPAKKASMQPYLGVANMKSMDEHFSQIADKYNDIRTTDYEPIEYIRDLFSKYERCVAVDIGCGPGRYSLLLLQMIPQLHLTCLDRSRTMIAETKRLLLGANISRFKIARAEADNFPLAPNAVDVVFTFNAVHHFILPAFLREARRVLKKPGLIVIYTRLPCQNETSIWGKYFPDFNTVERRLYSLTPSRQPFGAFPVWHSIRLNYSNSNA